jgi:hypothetical protein
MGKRKQESWLADKLGKESDVKVVKKERAKHNNENKWK